MGLNLDKCTKCKFDVRCWCEKRGRYDDPSICNGCDMNMGDTCHCLTVNNADECERFVPKEETDEPTN